MLEKHKEIIRATVPVLQENGEAITRVFYQQLFEAHPELLNLFNPVNQRDGGQARSLAASILAYAAHIDQLDQLGGMVNLIAHKHVSLQVLPEHYPVVGEHLLKAIRTVLGEAATPEILEAWAAAYGQLAQIMIDKEEGIYAEGAASDGGWRGYKPFTVLRKERESEGICSFYLAPSDGKPLPLFKPGQYLGVKARVPGSQYDQIRQYSLSHLPTREFYRISVKRETAPGFAEGTPHGQISNHLHDDVNVGDVVQVSMPAGNFVLDELRTDPLVLLSGGVGITPAICMLQHLAQEGKRPVIFVHATAGRDQHAFADEMRELEKNRNNVKSVVYYEKTKPEDIQGLHYDEIGRLTLESLRPHLPAGEAEFYYCGPLGFMSAVEGILDHLGVPLHRRYSEVFAPDPSFATAIARA
ncbi:NO-inducible flavohemoprotein [Acidipila rosea]|uniref:Flavohemoprotein n=1 Tax=Acidipila rosea TaxID=768535 RepID=A0A4R1L3H5_9BACT|nr:NO-inducible flavohemoprotein [Acidipila rosea]TCK72544.1 nitric oxide dioxygenase [Acidipila rosea]